MKAKLNFIIALLFLLFSCSDNGKTEDKPDDSTEKKPEWFDISKINDKTYILSEPKSSQGNAIYLIVGSERAIMFDTGSGENRAYQGSKVQYEIEEITELPVTLLLSHFHFDHNQNLAEFENVAFPDLNFLKEKAQNNVYKFSSSELFSGTYPSEVTVDEWWPLNTPIDLGGYAIEIINIPGHTSESVAIVDRQNKTAFLGDYLYNGALFLFSENDIPIYKQSVELLMNTLDDDFTLYGAHGTPQVSFSKLQELDDFLDCIMDNTCESTSTTVWGYDALYYKHGSMELLVFL